MIGRILKFSRMIVSRIKYKRITYFGAPRIVKCFGFDCVELPSGYYSQAGQDAILEILLQKYLEIELPPFVFVDVGCNLPETHNNSYYLEINKNFHVLAIDALDEFRRLWAEKRPNAKFMQTAVGENIGNVRFDVVQGEGLDHMLSSVSGSSIKASGIPCKQRLVGVTTLSQILKESNITKAAVVGIDVEGFEMNAVKGINFNDFESAIILVENNSYYNEGDNGIRDYLALNGYDLIGRIWNLDDIFVNRKYRGLIDVDVFKNAINSI